MSKMDGLLHRQLNRIYRRECHQLGRHLNGFKQSRPQSERIVCESDDILSYALEEKSLPGVYIAAKALQPELNEYFEIEVIECSAAADIALGIVPNNHPLDQMPGFVANSVGYLIQSYGSIILTTKLEYFWDIKEEQLWPTSVNSETELVVAFATKLSTIQLILIWIESIQSRRLLK